MDEKHFWGIIEQAKQGSQDHLERQVELIIQRLQPLLPEEIETFERIYLAFSRRSCSKHLWKALDTAMWSHVASLSDRDFHSFRAWLISQGETTFR